MNRRVKLRDISSLITKGTTPTTIGYQFVGEGIPFLRAEDINGGLVSVTSVEKKITPECHEAMRRSQLMAGDVLVTIAGTVGRVGSVPAGVHAANCNQAISIVRIKPGIFDLTFLLYALRSDPVQLQLRRQGTTATITNVSLAQIGDLEIPRIPLEEQHRLVDVLARAEGIIRLRRKAQKKAAELIPALFVDMFGDPVVNPKGWQEVSLGSVIEEFRYGTSQKSGPTGYPTLRIPNVIGDRIDSSEIKFVAARDAEVERLRLHEGDLLFVRTNGNPDYVGRSAVFNAEAMRPGGFDPENCLYASYLIRGRIMRQVVAPHFLQAFLSSIEGRRRLKERCRTSAGQYNINIDGLSNIVLPLPPLDRQLAFESRCSDIFSIQTQQNTATKQAEATFDALVSDAFSTATG